jgi:hypothetical protein
MSAAFEINFFKERRPRMSAALIISNAALNRVPFSATNLRLLISRSISNNVTDAAAGLES